MLNDIRSVAKISDLHEYIIDSMQRSILFTDILRKRGNIYLDHLAKGQPSVLIFDYEMIIDGRTLEKPVNYCLVRILDRRKEKRDQVSSGVESAKRDDRQDSRFSKRPIVVIDPRAGHGPGIGGSKNDSEIGLALNNGHPVYFIMFFTKPQPNQTIIDVQKAEVQFIEEVRKRHMDADKPVVIGNCQAGWAATLVAADKPDIVGPLILNGSPLSYWGGVEGSNPMRYRGGLIGGVWFNSFLSDIGNGLFDGANLVMNMEDLNPANTYWNKYYNVYKNVDTEEERFLEFEKWWGGFFMMTKEEIHFIVDSLFVGNRLERGKLFLDGKNYVNIKNIKEPIIVFASSGDNITPPQQALNWIAKVYKSTDEIKANNQVIIYLLHENIGHLGIFVSTKVAKKEHKEIIGSIDMISYISPGLYEMHINDSGIPGEYDVQFDEREIDDILALDDGFDDESDFLPVATLSKTADRYYNAYLSPIVSWLSNDLSFELVKQVHPLRTQRYIMSDLNPMLIPFKTLAKYVKKSRVKSKTTNIVKQAEGLFSEMMESSLDMYRDMRDAGHELVFQSLYGNPFVQYFYSEAFKKNVWSDERKIKDKKGPSSREATYLAKMDKGGFKEGVLRIMIAIASSDKIIAKSEFMAVQAIVRAHPKLSKMKPSEIRKVAMEQSRILQVDMDKALNSLPRLIHYKKDRREALEIAKKIALADSVVDESEKKMIGRIEKVLKI